MTTILSKPFTDLGDLPVQPEQATPTPVQQQTPTVATVQTATALRAAVQSATVQPATVQAATVQPATVQPATVQHATVQPATVQPATVQHATVQPRTVQPATVQPATVQPATVQPATVLVQRATPVVQRVSAPVTRAGANAGAPIVQHGASFAAPIVRSGTRAGAPIVRSGTRAGAPIVQRVPPQMPHTTPVQNPFGIPISPIQNPFGLPTSDLLSPSVPQFTLVTPVNPFINNPYTLLSPLAAQLATKYPYPSPDPSVPTTYDIPDIVVEMANAGFDTEMPFRALTKAVSELRQTMPQNPVLSPLPLGLSSPLERLAGFHFPTRPGQEAQAAYLQHVNLLPPWETIPANIPPDDDINPRFAIWITKSTISGFLDLFFNEILANNVLRVDDIPNLATAQDPATALMYIKRQPQGPGDIGFGPVNSSGLVWLPTIGVSNYGLVVCSELDATVNFGLSADAPIIKPLKFAITYAAGPYAPAPGGYPYLAEYSYPRHPALNSLDGPFWTWDNRNQYVPALAVWQELDVTTDPAWQAELDCPPNPKNLTAPCRPPLDLAALPKGLEVGRFMTLLPSKLTTNDSTLEFNYFSPTNFGTEPSGILIQGLITRRRKIGRLIVFGPLAAEEITQSISVKRQGQAIRAPYTGKPFVVNAQTATIVDGFDGFKSLKFDIEKIQGDNESPTIDLVSASPGIEYSKRIGIIDGISQGDHVRLAVSFVPDGVARQISFVLKADEFAQPEYMFNPFQLGLSYLASPGLNPMPPGFSLQRIIPPDGGTWYPLDAWSLVFDGDPEHWFVPFTTILTFNVIEGAVAVGRPIQVDEVKIILDILNQ